MSATCDPSQLINDARCWDSCIPPGMMASVMIGCSLEPFTPPMQLGIRGEGSDEFILDESGKQILPET